jgi:hypothetical protein
MSMIVTAKLEVEFEEQQKRKKIEAALAKTLAEKDAVIAKERAEKEALAAELAALKRRS